jgi:hypothetical protein
MANAQEIETTGILVQRIGKSPSDEEIYSVTRRRPMGADCVMYTRAELLQLRDLLNRGSLFG